MFVMSPSQAQAGDGQNRKGRLVEVHSGSGLNGRPTLGKYVAAIAKLMCIYRGLNTTRGYMLNRN